MSEFEVVEDKDRGIKTQVVKVKGEKYLVSTVDLLPPEMEKSFSEKIVNNVREKGKFETSIFSFKKGKPDLGSSVYGERYDTEEEASKGHEEVLKKLEKGEIGLTKE